MDILTACRLGLCRRGGPIEPRYLFPYHLACLMEDSAPWEYWDAETIARVQPHIAAAPRFCQGYCDRALGPCWATRRIWLRHENQTTDMQLADHGRYVCEGRYNWYLEISWEWNKAGRHTWVAYERLAPYQEGVRLG